MLPATCPRCGTPTEPDARFCGVCGGQAGARCATVPPLAPRCRAAATPAAHPGAARPSPGPAARSAVRPAACTWSPPRCDMDAPTPARSPAHRPAPPSPRRSAAARLATPSPASRARRPAAAREPGGPHPQRPLRGRRARSARAASGRSSAGARSPPGARWRSSCCTRTTSRTPPWWPASGARPRPARSCPTRTRSSLYDFDETEDGVLYLAMELLRGRPLQDVQRQEGPLDPRARAGHPGPGGRGAGRGPRPGHRPPGHEARERHGRQPRGRGLRQGARLRHRQDRRRADAGGRPWR